MKTVTRKSVPLELADLALLQSLRVPASPERRAAESLAGELPESLSEAQAIKVLVDLGKEVVAEAVLNAQYASFAAAMDEEDLAFEQAARSRRRRVAD